MTQLKRYTAILMAVAFAYSAQGQDSLKTNVFHVDKVLKPLLSEAIKIQSNPNPEVPQIKVPVFEYTSIPENRHEASPTIYTIKPLSMGTSLLPRLKNNYTRMGYGNYNTPLLEIYLNSLRNKDLQAGVFFKHLSSNPEGDKTFSDNTLHAYAKKYSLTGALAADMAYQRNNVFLYGYQPDNLKPLASDIRQLFQAFDLKGSYSNIVKDSNAITYKLGVDYYNFFDARDLSENDFRLTGDFNKLLQGNPLSVHTQIHLTGIKHPLLEYQRVFVDLKPRYTLRMNDLYLKVGFNATIFSDSAKTTLYPFPVAEAGYSLISKALTAFAGITGNVQRHTYRSIINENPFTRGLGFRNTANKFEVYGGFKGSLGPQTSFLLQGGWAVVQNLMFYGVDSAQYYSQVVLFDTTNAGVMNIKTELTHEFSDVFRLAFTFNYYSYNLQFAHPYSRPTLETRLNAMYNVGDKFILRADVFTMNQRYARVFRSASATDETIKGLVDLNLGLDYRYNKNISVFFNLNNLTANTYQRWYSYPVYGINVLGGLTVSF